MNDFIIQQRFAAVINRPKPVCMIKTMKLRKHWVWYEKHMLKFINDSILQTIKDVLWIERLMK